jgi:hypothetical protein
MWLQHQSKRQLRLEKADSKRNVITFAWSYLPHKVRASVRGTGLVGDAPVGTIKPRNGGFVVLVVNISGRLYLCAASAL